MIKMAKTEDGMSVSFDRLDSDHYLLGVQNGVLDLKKKELIELTPDCYVVKRAGVAFEPEADAPRFKKFLEEILPDPELREFLMRLLGYLMTGSVREHKWFFFYGEGRNGKGVVARILMKLLGEYAQKIETHILMQGAPKAQNAASPEILSLQGKRFLSGNETREGQAWDDARIKDMTGGDPQSGRFNHQNNYVQFDPTYKIVVAGNNFPMARDSSKGFWDRIVVFPFNKNLTPEEIDGDLEENHLNYELSGIFNLLLDGLEDYLKNGLKVPKTLLDATNKYKDESDLIKQFVRDCCIKDPESKVKVKEVYPEYREWAAENGLAPLAQPRFSRALVKQHGITKGRDQRSFIGIKVPNDFSRRSPF
jgi:putative DNA primase/helicase